MRPRLRARGACGSGGVSRPPARPPRGREGRAILCPMQIALTTRAAPEDAAALRAGIVGFNHAMVPALEPIEAEVRFFVFARGDDGAVVGGIRAACYWNTLHIELLWLP